MYNVCVTSNIAYMVAVMLGVIVCFLSLLGNFDVLAGFLLVLLSHIQQLLYGILKGVRCVGNISNILVVMYINSCFQFVVNRFSWVPIV